MKCLVVDDDPFTASLMRSILESMGLDCVSAADGATAWAHLQAPNPPHLVLLDWMLPDVEGVDLCRRLRKTQSHSHPYVVMVTSRVGQRDQVLALEAGADDYLSKPFGVSELRARVSAATRLLKEMTWSVEDEVRGLVKERATGELVVIEGERIGRILFSEGFVVWIQLSFLPSDAVSVLRGTVDASPEDAAAWLREAVDKDIPFPEVVARNTGVPVERVSHRIRERFAGLASALLAMRPRSLHFAPADAGYRQGLRFGLDELIGPEFKERSSMSMLAPLGRMTLSRQAWSTLVESLEAGIKTHALSRLALFHGRVAECVAQSGGGADTDLVRPLVKLLYGRAEYGQLNDISVRSPTETHVISRLRERSEFCLYAAAEGASDATLFEAVRAIIQALPEEVSQRVFEPS